MGFNLYGMLAFDALFIFDPFSFIISLEATLAIRKGTSILFGIHFKGKLSGPTPWHVEGEVTFGILFFDITIGFSATWGDPPPVMAAATEDLLALLKKELDALPNWRTDVKDSQHQFVTLKSLEDENNAPLVLHPFGELIFSQRSIPLNYTIEKYGTKKPKDDKRLEFSEVRIGSQETGTATEKELFAPGHYTKLTEKEKLNRKSFEPLDSGFRLSDSGKLLTASPHLEPLVMDYELNYTEDDIEKSKFTMAIAGFKHMASYAAVSRSEIGWRATALNAKNRPEEVSLNKGGYAIASTANLKAHTVQDAQGKEIPLMGDSLAEINEIYNTIISEDPQMASELQIVENFELVN
jgi:hypothetical protein